MNRRALLQMIGLAPVVAMVPAKAEPTVVGMDMASGPDRSAYWRVRIEGGKFIYDGTIAAADFNRGDPVYVVNGVAHPLVR